MTGRPYRLEEYRSGWRVIATYSTLRLAKAAQPSRLILLRSPRWRITRRTCDGTFEILWETT